MPFFERLRAGIQKIGSNPQLIYTILIAVIIVGAFIFMASRFIGIAGDAQDRLVNVRIGSLQDAFVSFAADRMDDPAYLNARIDDVIRSNETIQQFRIVQKRLVFTDATTTAYIIIASNDRSEIGKASRDTDVLYSLVSGDPSHSFTTETKRGSERYFNTARAIVDAQQNVVGVALTTQTLSQADRAIEKNITDSIYLLIAVIVLILFLFLRHSRIVDYMDLYRRLKEVDQFKDDFISMASHELRAPLTIIRGYAEFLNNSKGLPTEATTYAQKIEFAAKGLDALVSDMLEVSRIEQGRMEFKMELCDVRDIVAAAVSSFELLAHEKGLQLSLDQSKAAADQIMIDAARLRQVMVNLIGNALKYTKAGGVTISQYSEDGRALIRISDTGMGISAENREKLFQKFFRIHSHETESIIGTGLGLWITAQLVKEMRGTISIESIVGVGSHFIVSFPVAH